MTIVAARAVDAPSWDADSVRPSLGAQRDSPVRAGAGPRTNDGARHRFWVSYLATGFSVQLLEALAMVGYLLATPRGTHRVGLLILATISAGLACGGLGVAGWLAGQSWRRHFWLAWCIGGCVVMAVDAHLDGGLESPLLFMSVLPVMSTMLALSPRAVASCTGVAVAGLVTVRLTDVVVELSVPSVLMLSALVVGTGWLAVASARQRARTESHDALLVDQLQHLAATDALTGCANQQTFHERLRAEADRAVRHSRPLSVIICDVDLFKTFNDFYGHAAGDEALADVGACLRSVARLPDFVARVGGDEFGIILPETTATQAAFVARRILSARRAAVQPTVTVSIGVAELDPTDPSPIRLFRDADRALYDAKESGRQAVVTTDNGRQVVRSGHDATRRDAQRANHKRSEEAVRQARRESDETRSILDALMNDAPIGLAFIDTDFRVVRVNPTMAAIYESTPEDVGRHLAEIVPHLWPTVEPFYRRVLEDEVPVLDLDVRGPTGADGTKIHDWVASLYPVHSNHELVGIGVVVLDVTDRKRLERAGRDLTDAVVRSLGAIAEARDPYTAGHQRRVSQIAAAIATELGHDAHTVKGIGLAAAVHDIGKIAIPADILARPGQLRKEEMDLVRTHAVAGHDMLSEIDFPWPIAEMVRQHHERIDGSGYPDHLRGDEISIGARIIAVADVVEAVAAHRPYRASLGIDKALAIVDEGKGRIFDAEVVDGCLRLFRNGRLSVALARLLSGETEELEPAPAPSAELAE